MRCHVVAPVALNGRRKTGKRNARALCDELDRLPTGVFAAGILRLPAQEPPGGLDEQVAHARIAMLVDERRAFAVTADVLARAQAGVAGDLAARGQDGDLFVGLAQIAVCTQTILA